MNKLIKINITIRFSKLFALIYLMLCISFVFAKPWRRHTIDSPNVDEGKLGADGVRLADFNSDGFLDITTGWEQGGAIVVYQNPRPQLVKLAWPSVTVGRVVSPEDAVFIDLNSDGNLDVVSSCEGKAKAMYVHWAPVDKDQYLKAEAWKTEIIKEVQGNMWMFAEPAQIDGRGGVDLFISSKGNNASIGWLTRNVTEVNGFVSSSYNYVKLRNAGWVMTLKAIDMDKDGDMDLLFSDRKGESRGVGWLENPSGNKAYLPAEWKEHMIGGVQYEVMFLDVGDINKNQNMDIICATRNMMMLQFEKKSKTWKANSIPNPNNVNNGKSVAIGDIDGDGNFDLVHTSNTGGNRKVSGVMWMKYSKSTWSAYDISGSLGVKFDIVELIDLDDDGDLDVVTCEENDNLGVFWYENPLYDSDKIHRITSD